MIFKKDHFSVVSAILKKVDEATLTTLKEITKDNVMIALSSISKKYKFEGSSEEEIKRIQECQKNNAWCFTEREFKLLEKGMCETFFRLSALDITKTIITKSDKIPWKRNKIDSSIFYFPKINANGKGRGDEGTILKILFEYNIIADFCENDKDKQKYEFTEEDDFFINALAALAVQTTYETVDPTVLTNKWVNKLVAYWTYKYILYDLYKLSEKGAPLEKMKIGKKKPKSKFAMIVFETLAQQEPVNKVILEYVAKALTSKIRMKAYSYIHIDTLNPFNYSDLLSIYPLSALNAVKTTFNLKELKKAPEAFYKIPRKDYITIQDFEGWNKEAKLLIDSPYFEYYKARLVYYRKLKKENPGKSIKLLLTNNPYCLLSNNSFESFIRSSDFSKEEISDIVSKVNATNTSMTTEIADSIMRRNNPEIIYNYINSLNIFNAGVIRTSINSSLLEFVAKYHGKRDFVGMMKAYAADIEKVQKDEKV